MHICIGYHLLTQSKHKKTLHTYITEWENTPRFWSKFRLVNIMDTEPLLDGPLPLHPIFKI